MIATEEALEVAFQDEVRRKEAAAEVQARQEQDHRKAWRVLHESPGQLDARAAAIRAGRAQPVSSKDIRLKVDDDGVGGGVVDVLRADGYPVVAVGAGTRAARENDYPNKRSELWFQVADRGRRGQLSLARRPAKVRARLKQQAMAPVWAMDSRGRRVVERKEDTKEKLGRSPDDPDALLLAYHDAATFEKPPTVDTPRREVLNPREAPRAGRPEMCSTPDGVIEVNTK